MATMLRDFVVDVVVVVLCTHLRAIPLAMITTTELVHGFPFIFRDAYGTSPQPYMLRSYAMCPSFFFHVNLYPNEPTILVGKEQKQYSSRHNLQCA